MCIERSLAPDVERICWPHAVDERVDLDGEMAVRPPVLHSHSIMFGGERPAAIRVEVSQYTSYLSATRTHAVERARRRRVDLGVCVGGAEVGA